MQFEENASKPMIFHIQRQYLKLDKMCYENHPQFKSWCISGSQHCVVPRVWHLCGLTIILRDSLSPGFEENLTICIVHDENLSLGKWKKKTLFTNTDPRFL